MSTPLLAIVTMIYLGVGVSELRAGRPAMCLVFAAYALANVGLIWNIMQVSK